ncbi:NmrA/HSCARG family protein [Kineosporia sp. J2-2]|uniref:NmrA/HSCARG family protein n=1 Tax=Kineosporia corallincola TaxID=2835133 RepID=A0ABS5TC83_9ACTN|nr:NmrA/HSCARG family protein [Kineosporia corallincola]MBT0768692.1 NmrA/HSCARG family protein [Kineosporia corallincola]
MTGTILVTGATGRQGGATARALLGSGVPVRALVRDPAKAAGLEELGAELVQGDLLEPGSLAPALRGVRGVFSVQMPPIRDGQFRFDDELTQATNLIGAARAAGVAQFVQTTVSGADRTITRPEWAAQQIYYDTKTAIENAGREAGFEYWNLLRPGTFMDNLLPSQAYLMPRGLEGGLVTVIRPQTRLSLVAVHDIGSAAAAFFREPERFRGVELELASDYLSMAQIAATVSRVLGVPLGAPDLTEQEALDAGMPPYAAIPHAMLNEVGQPARPEFARELGLQLTSFEEWARSVF